MRRAAAFVLTSCIAGATLVMASAPERAAQEPAFRVSTDLVTVDVLVFRGREPVQGLTASDFELTDNGVRQTVTSINVPGGAHVIAVLDTSASVAGDVLQRLTEAVEALLVRLTDEDRVSVVTFGDRVRLLQRAARPASALDVVRQGLTAAGGTALHDALLLGSALTAADGRPAVMVAFTDGADTVSWTTAPHVLRVLQASNVVVFPVGAGLVDLPVSAARLQPSLYLSSPTWLVPDAGDASRLLDRVARVSGGSFIRVGRPDALARTFTEIIDRYRSRYVLSYTPTGVGRDDGWHRIEVKLVQQRGTVQAREGYIAGR
jgi:VWFA-related protein